jgi:hypothetical protein
MAALCGSDAVSLVDPSMIAEDAVVPPEQDDLEELAGTDVMAAAPDASSIIFARDPQGTQIYTAAMSEPRCAGITFCLC